MGVILRDLRKEFDSPDDRQKKVVAVDNINLDIKEGEMVTLLGPSGCGKTTTLRMIAGFEVPTAGRIFLGGKDITNLTPDQRDTAMVFQNYAIFPHMTVADNVGFGLSLRKIPKAETAQRVDAILELVGLAGMGKRMPDQLSGGQQQRVALARAIITEPKVLLFDEPLSNLDAKLREQMRLEIRRIQQHLGITAVYVTHDQSEAMAISDRIVVMNQGRIEQMGTPWEIYNRPRTSFVADFIGQVNFVEAEVVGSAHQKLDVKVWGQVIAIKHAEPLPVGTLVKLVLRPEAVHLDEQQAFATGVVNRAVYLGSVVEYDLIVEETNLHAVVSSPIEKGIHTVGDQVSVYFSPEVVHVIPA
ncbi:MAG: ABC transporter ATP-binding protein [Firmicutes bacterium]|jgi:iron(III) transport system ATP-binding protein|nr:ABC transporter ATP-binding protein [Bacillota bacterium]